MKSKSSYTYTYSYFVLILYPVLRHFRPSLILTIAITLFTASHLAHSNEADVLISLYNKLATLTKQQELLMDKVEQLEFEISQKQKRTEIYRLDNEKRIKELDRKIAELEAEIATITNDEARSNISQEVPSKSSSASKTQTDQQAYDQALDLLFASKYDKSFEILVNFSKNYPNSPLQGHAFYWKGEVQYALNEVVNAEKTFQEFLETYKNSEKMPAAMYKLAILKENDSPEQSVKLFEDIIKIYPNSSAANLSKKRLIRLQTNS